MFVVLITYPEPTAVEAHREAHRAHIRAHAAKGAILVSGPQSPRTGGVIVSTATSRPEVEAMIEQDPYMRAGVATYEVIEFDAINGTAVKGAAA